jgi:GntR family transcriptional regulator of gluconate operon
MDRHPGSRRPVLFPATPGRMGPRARVESLGRISCHAFTICVERGTLIAQVTDMDAEQESAGALVADVADGAVLRPLASPRSLIEQAVELLRGEIISGRLPQGERLVETKIAQQLEVSRGTVREAFKLLRADGLVREEPRRGTFVVSLSAKDAGEIYELRAAVEGVAARRLAASGDKDRIAELSELYLGLEQAVAKANVFDFFAADLAFHDALCRLSGNTRIHEVFGRYVPMLRAMLRLDSRIEGSLIDSVHQHHALVVAIEAGDSERARDLAEQHSLRAGESVVRSLASRQTP